MGMKYCLMIISLLLTGTTACFAAEGTIDSGDTAWVSILATIAFSAAATLAVVYVTRFVTGGLRVDAQDEQAGLDNALHGERAFEIE